jgi:hypothetical protein
MKPSNITYNTNYFMQDYVKPVFSFHAPVNLIILCKWFLQFLDKEKKLTHAWYTKLKDKVTKPSHTLCCDCTKSTKKEKLSIGVYS